MKSIDRFKQQMYKKIEDINIDDINRDIEKSNNDKINYPNFHIAPKFGLLNDPNGLSYYNGEYQIFYQHCPGDVKHGMKNWHHLTTKDFITYNDYGIKLKPEKSFENYGVYSGGAIQVGDNLKLFYTGNERKEDKNYKRYPNQCVATMDKDYNILDKKLIIEPDQNITEHFRDPIPLYINEENIIIVGCQNSVTYEGCIRIYYTDDTFTYIKKDSFLKTNFPLQGVFMYECPCYVSDEENEAIIFSPQGIENKTKYEYNNIYNVAYSISYKGDILDANWESKNVYQLDYGFDFYAPQTFIDHLGRSILIGWLGQATNETYPFDEQNRWSQMLTIPREITIKGNKLYQKPIEEINNLREKEIIINSGTNIIDTKTFELSFNTKGDFDIKLGNKKDFIQLSRVNNEIIFDRSNMSHLVNEEFGNARYLNIYDEELTVKMFVDKSCIEIFINEGEYVMTSRYFIDEFNAITIENCYQMQMHNLLPIKFNDFV